MTEKIEERIGPESVKILIEYYSNARVGKNGGKTHKCKRKKKEKQKIKMRMSKEQFCGDWQKKWDGKY